MQIYIREVKDKNIGYGLTCIFVEQIIAKTFKLCIMAENKSIKSKRDIALERLRGRYPEEQFDDDEQIFGRINDDFDQFDSELAGYKEREGRFSDLFTSDPRSARLMMDWKDGVDPAVGLIRLYGEDIKEAIDDPERQEAIAEANREYMERVSKEQEYEQEYTSNLEASLTTLEQVQQETGLSDDEINDAMALLITVAKDAMLGKFTHDTILMAIKARNYDNDVAQAEAEGEVRGKNTKVTETLRKPKRGDGTAHLDGKNGGGPRPSIPDMGAIDRFADGNMSIFERGGERRVPIKR